MINKADNISFSGVKYTKAGKRFLKKQSAEAKNMVKDAENKMKNYRYSNFIIVQDGYAIQKREKTGVHAYKIDQVLFSYNSDAMFYLKNAKKNVKVCVPDANDKYAERAARCACEDASQNNNWLNSSLLFAEIIEKQALLPMKDNFMKKIFKYVRKNLGNKIQLGSNKIKNVI